MEVKKEYRERALQMFASAGLGPTSRHSFLESVATMLQKAEEREQLPLIVCLCGSTRFYKEFQEANFKLTMKGEIVLSVGFFANAKESDWQLRDAHGENVGITAEQKISLDALHKRKIDLANYVYVIDVDGYIGESTRSEINYAHEIHKPVVYRSLGARGI